MRVVSYNILDGGLGRADPVAEVLLAQRPDVIGLVEADDQPNLDRIVRRLGMDCVRAAGSEHASAVISRWPIIKTINLAAADPECARSALLATLDVPGMGEIDFAIVHLSPHQTIEAEQVRQRQIGRLLALLQTHRSNGVPHVLMGDFNAISPMHQIDPARLDPDKAALIKTQGDLPRQAIADVLQAGYQDTLAAVHGDAADRAATFTTLYPALRVDFIFSFALTPVDAWIETDRLATFASDHLPVGAELKSL